MSDFEKQLLVVIEEFFTNTDVDVTKRAPTLDDLWFWLRDKQEGNKDE